VETADRSCRVCGLRRRLKENKAASTVGRPSSTPTHETSRHPSTRLFFAAASATPSTLTCERSLCIHSSSIRLVAPSRSIAALHRECSRLTTMASTADQPSTAPQSTPQPAGAGSRPQSRGEALPSSPVEMRTLQAPGAAHESTNTTKVVETPAPAAITPSTLHVAEPSIPENAHLALSSPTKPAPPTALNRAETEAIGPSTDTPAANPDNTNGPVLVIMLLLTSGARHPYKIEKKYLQKRKIDVENMDPYKISVYTLKELIWRDWREGTHAVSLTHDIYWVGSPVLGRVGWQSLVVVALAVCCTLLSMATSFHRAMTCAGSHQASVLVYRKG
jgi:hypothetical protein